MAQGASKDDDAAYLSAKDAAARLNVSLATLYTYVSRKKLRAVRNDGRASRYHRADIERLLASSAQKGSKGFSPTSTITEQTPDGIFYRGVSAIELSRSATVEDVAALLWDCDGNPFGQPATRMPANWDALWSVSENMTPFERVSMLLPAVEISDIHAHDMSSQGLYRSGANILRWATAIALGSPTPQDGPIHSRIAQALPSGHELEDAIRRVLVLAADRRMESTVYAVRATASAGATPYRCILSGLAAATGSRLPSARISTFGRFLQEIETSADPHEPVLSRIREREPVPGFSYFTAEFNDRDPRAVELYDFMRDALPDNPAFKRMTRAFAVASEVTGRHPEFSFLAACVARLAGAEPALGLVRLGRLSGWLAHAFEELLSDET